MWCDNCLLLFPLRGGAMVLAGLVALYSIAGAVFLFLYGDFLYFTYPEPQLYGGVGIAAGLLAVLFIIALSNNSYMWTRVLAYLSPIVLFLLAVRAGLMIFRLDYYQSDVIWECNHGGQPYNATIANSTTYNSSDYSGSVIPTGFCSAGFHSVYLAFAFALVIDVILQLYMYFLTWRFKVWLEKLYFGMRNNGAGIYAA